MKTNIFLTAFLMLFIITGTQAQHHHSSGHHDQQHEQQHQHEQHNTMTDYDSYRTDSFTVYGNCEMCEKTIESSLKGVKGIAMADWNKETDILSVTYHPSVISLDVIKQRIANVGYDSDTHRATDESYNNLPGCCQYERPGKAAVPTKNQNSHNH